MRLFDDPAIQGKIKIVWSMARRYEHGPLGHTRGGKVPMSLLASQEDCSGTSLLKGQRFGLALNGVGFESQLGYGSFLRGLTQSFQEHSGTV
jgi:hypothetical protein